LGTAKTARKADAEGRNWNCREQPELPGTAGTIGKDDEEGKSQNNREQPELPKQSGKLTQRAEAGTAEIFLCWVSRIWHPDCIMKLLNKSNPQIAASVFPHWVFLGTLVQK